jgi:hypothetical protein
MYSLAAFAALAFQGGVITPLPVAHAGSAKRPARGDAIAHRRAGAWAAAPGGLSVDPYFVVLRRSFRMASSASITSSRDARLLAKLNLSWKALVGGR